MTSAADASFARVGRRGIYSKRNPFKIIMPAKRADLERTIRSRSSWPRSGRISIGY
jgi:hypothetical protein